MVVVVVPSSFSYSTPSLVHLLHLILLLSFLSFKKILFEIKTRLNIYMAVLICNGKEANSMRSRVTGVGL